MTRAKELRDQSAEELTVRHEELCQQLFSLNNERRESGKLEQPHAHKATRREIARVLTVLREKRGKA